MRSGGQGRDQIRQKAEISGIPDHNSGVRLDMVLGEICVWVTAEGRRRGYGYESCAAPILYLQAVSAKNFIATCSQAQRYEFYRAAFEPLERFVRRRTDLAMAIPGHRVQQS